MRTRPTIRLAARLRYLLLVAPTDHAELLSAFLSGTFAATLIRHGNNANALDYAYAFAVLCLTAAVLKMVGVLTENVYLRIAGLLLGTMFWIALSGVLLLSVPNSIAWLCFGVLAIVQLWCVVRLVRDRW